MMNLQKENLLRCDCVILSLSKAGVQQAWSTYNLIVTVLGNKMLETTNLKRKMVHIASSSALVSKFEASKLIVYWKSMGHERFIGLPNLSHQFTM